MKPLAILGANLSRPAMLAASCSKPAPEPSKTQVINFSIVPAEDPAVHGPGSGSRCSTTCRRPPA